MNTTVEKVKLALGVSEIKKTDKGILLGSKERGIICRMSFADEECLHIDVKTPKREVLYYPVNATVPEVIGVIHNMVKHEPGKDTELWYEKELKRSEEKPSSRGDQERASSKGDQERPDRQDRSEKQDRPSGKRTGFRRNRRRSQSQ